MALKRKQSISDGVSKNEKVKIFKETKQNESKIKDVNKPNQTKNDLNDGSPKISRKKFGDDKGKGFHKPHFKKQNLQKLTKPDWQKLKNEKKDLREKRKQEKPHYEMSTEMKKLYETLKCKSTNKGTKEELSEKLYKLLKSNIHSFVLRHDTARIVQCVLKNGNKNLRKELSEELLPLTVEMSTLKYAHFCVLRMLKFGDKNVKKKLIDSLFGSIYKLTLHQISSTIIDIIYTTHASNTQKIMMKQELYGDLYKNHKDLTIKELSDTYNQSPELKNGILSAVKGNLLQFANKNLLDNSLVHVVLHEYLMECKDEDFEELVGTFSGKIPLLLTTREGCKAAIQLFWKASTKDRRSIVKSIKEHIIKVSMHDQGHIFLIAVINSMDDTKAIKKNLFDPLYTKLDEIMLCNSGRKVIEWFVAPSSTDNFHPELIKFLDEGIKYGKKPTDVRRKEIFEQIEEPLSNAICANISFWMSNGQIGLVTAAILKKLSSTYFCNVAESIAKLITMPTWTCDAKENGSKNIADEQDEDNLGIEDSGLHIVLKKMIKGDEIRISSKEETLGGFILRHLTTQTIDSWINVNRACFILLNILKNSDDNDKNKLKQLLLDHMKDLKSKNHTGAKLLLDELEKN